MISGLAGPGVCVEGNHCQDGWLCVGLEGPEGLAPEGWGSLWVLGAQLAVCGCLSAGCVCVTQVCTCACCGGPCRSRSLSSLVTIWVHDDEVARPCLCLHARLQAELHVIPILLTNLIHKPPNIIFDHTSQV